MLPRCPSHLTTELPLPTPIHMLSRPWHQLGCAHSSRLSCMAPSTAFVKQFSVVYATYVWSPITLVYIAPLNMERYPHAVPHALRRIYRLLYQSQCKIQLLLIPSSKNIADPFSRGLLQPPLPHSVYDNTVPYIRYCHTPTRLWCHWSLFHLPLFSLSPMLQLKPTRFGVW